MRTKQHKLIFTILIIYTALIVYFLFFGVGRPGAVIGIQEYRFNLIPNIISFSFPTISDLKYFPRGFFELGNFAGFIPFGILIPRLYRCNFFRFISLFFLSILIIETVQMLTFLGSFDINDIIVNSLGAAVGFCAYKIGFRFKSIRKKLVVTVMSVVILSIGVIGFSELLNKSFTKIEGPIIALNELDSNRNVPMDKNLQSFEIEHEKIEPKINLYGSESYDSEVFTYIFGGKDIVLSLNYGIPDNSSDYDGMVVISVDGEEMSISPMSKEYRGPSSSESPMDKVNELTITIKGNVKLWDVTFKEMKYWWD
ncbi:VanZ family protein [Sporosarcina sp. FSL K6-3457]|uniref:VanZ family protein n=1 Tax=Sporosarcina sp. FSL K6-3457 TaxID=2978204 RepID=UPI0030FD179C